jgi:predicted SAM-dependent methyltransferase
LLFNPRKRLDRHLVDALDTLGFELISAKSRWLARKRIDRGDLQYLQLGCGSDLIAGFLNTDHPLNRRADASVDARFGLPFQDNSFKEVYAHHVIEHLDYQDAYRVFSEVGRVLTPGGTFRMIVPDLKTFLNRYHNDSAGDIFRLLPPWHMENWAVETPLEMVDFMFRDNKFNRHLSSWDFDTAELRLQKARFSRIVRQSVNKSLDTNLAGHDKEDWAAFSLYVEAVK